jgi:hypothetical protein
MCRLAPKGYIPIQMDGYPRVDRACHGDGKRCPLYGIAPSAETVKSLSQPVFRAARQGRRLLNGQQQVPRPALASPWMPHSFTVFCSHHQRPARASSPGCVGRVQGAQPMLV